MMDRLRSIDDMVIAFFQEVYLWIWDRTGIYVGAIAFTCVAIEHALSDHGLTTFGLIAIAFMSLWCGARYYAQAKDLKAFNAIQRSWREFYPRVIFTLLLFPIFFATDLANQSWSAAISDLLFYTWNFLGCVQVREREPTDFFASLKLAGATQ